MTRTVVRIVHTLAVAILVGCATPYQEGGFRGGVTAVPLGGDVFRVEAGLNAFSSQSMVQDYLLLRAAEAAQQNGADGFVILGAQNTSTQGSFVTPGSSQTYGSAYQAGNVIYGQATTTYNPAQVHTYVRPGGILMIQLVRQPITPGLQYFRAADLIAAIGPRVDLTSTQQTGTQALPSAAHSLPRTWFVGSDRNAVGHAVAATYIETSEIWPQGNDVIRAVSRTIFASDHPQSELAGNLGELMADFDCGRRSMRMIQARLIDRSFSTVRDDRGTDSWQAIPQGTSLEATFVFVCSADRSSAIELPAGVAPIEHATPFFQQANE